jgi:hypothetical protein
LHSCDNGIKQGSQLSKEEISFVNNLFQLDSNESIIQFHSQSGELDEVKQAGNFYTEKRIASYWIDNSDKSRTKINSAFYSEIDTVIFRDHINDWENGSYLRIKTDNQTKEFKTYVNGDSISVHKFVDSVFLLWSNQNK